MSTKQNNENLGFAILLLAGLLYSTYGVFSRVIGDNIAPFYQYLSRAFVILIILIVAAILKIDKIHKINKKRRGWIVIQGLSSGILIPTFYLAVNKLPLATTIFLFYALSTIVSYVLGRYIHNEKLTQVKLVSFFLAISGIFIMSLESFRLNQPLYVILGLISGIFFGINLTAIKVTNKEYPSIQVNIFNWLGVLAVSLFISLLARETWSAPILNLTWISNLGLAIVSLGASLAAITGFKYIELQKGSIVLLSEFVFGVIIGLFLYHEVPTPLLILGSLLIIIALLLPNLHLHLNAKIQEKV